MNRPSMNIITVTKLIKNQEANICKRQDIYKL
jgi:hypothetical protein